MSLKQNLHWFLYPIFMLACAKQTSPTGGPKDTIPPVLTTSRPFNQQTNYTSSSIELDFSERLALNNPNEQIIITPNIGNKFEAQAKKNTVLLKFDTPFLPNTTYSINFRDAVQDITEKNPAENLKLAFSTGRYIDSLTISGIVIDLLKSIEIKEATVAIYQSDTFNIFKHKPIYFTKTDSKGKFQLTNLKPGTYYIYAFNDNNKNLVVESKSESYGYLTKAIELTTNVANAKIPLIRLDARPLKLTSARPSGTYFNIKTSKNLYNYRIRTLSINHPYSSFGEDAANIQIYTNPPIQDSLLVNLTATDSLENTLDTLLYVKSAARASTPEKFEITPSKFRLLTSKGILAGTINFNKPLLKINFDSVYYKIDSTRRITLARSDITLDSNNNILRIHKAFPKELLTKEPSTQVSQKQTNQSINTPKQPPDQTQKKNQNNQLYFGKGMLVSVELDSSARSSTMLTPTNPENTGTIIASINTKQGSYLLQLITKDYLVIATAYNNNNPIFEDLEPGEYRLRLVIDENKDSKWSPGNYIQHIEPEQILYYTNAKSQTIITLKANWEIGPLLITY